MAEHSEEIADPDCWRCATELADAAEAAGADVISTALHLFGVMYLCPTCGNKRCPKATDHRLDCTNSNEPGQVGRYPMGEPYGFYADRPGPDGYPGDALIDAANEAIDLRAEVDRMRAAVVTALAELDEEHRPLWSSDEAKARGKDPIGCALCWPGDGHWPCSSRLIADDLRAALSDSSGGEG